jgi:hypothetical protein
VFAAKHIIALSKRGGGEESPTYQHVIYTTAIFTHLTVMASPPHTLAKKEPENITKIRELKTLSVQDRILLLSCGPLFQLDPDVY